MTAFYSGLNQTTDTAYLQRGVDHLGFIESKLRDLRGFSTLVYELIQNADDAPKATSISFDIRENALIVDNNGFFTDCGKVESPVCLWKDDPQKGHLCDFHRFRAVASADKRREEGTTGAFGIGFIAVYQITDHPELISGGRHWILHDEDPEDKRIHVCRGCKKCKAPDLPKTRFILPWATDPHSDMRRVLRAEPVSQDDQVHLIRELELKLPVAMIFLKNIDRIEIKQNGKLYKYFERIKEREQILVSDGNKENDHIWNIIEGDFETSAKALREKNPGRIEEKRSYEVKLALPEKLFLTGLFCVCLPTEHKTDLPFHINADFFPSSDRKKIILESDYQSQWNHAAIEGAAEALVKTLEKLPKLLGHKSLWEALGSILNVWQEAKDGKRHPVFGSFWERILPNLKNSSIIFTERKEWVKPHEALLLVDKDEEEALPVFDALGLKIVHSEIRPFVFSFPRREIGIEQLDLEHVINALQDKGLTERMEISSLPKIFQNEDGLMVLYQEIIRLLKRQRSPEKKRELQKGLSSCAIVLGKDGALWPCNKIYRADAKTIALFNQIDSNIPFLAYMGEDTEEIVHLCPEFTAQIAIDFLKNIIQSQISIGLLNQKILKELLDWFELRREEILNDNEVRKKLIDLPIFPGPEDRFYPLSKLALPGDFEDPIGITEIIDLKRVSGKREFLQGLGAKPLSFEVYVKEHIPRALNDFDLPKEKRRATVQLLGKELGKITENKEIRKVLGALPLIECEDHVFRLADEVYFPGEVVKEIFGEDVHYAFISPDQSEAIIKLYEMLGVSRLPRPTDIVNRVYSLTKSPPTQNSVERIIKTILYIGEIWQKEETIREGLEPLKDLAWLPAKGKPEKWFTPKDLYTGYREYLFESQAIFLGIPRDIQNNIPDFLNWLGIKTEPKLPLVVKHLLYCSEKNIPVNREVYNYLNNKGEDRSINQLIGKACLLLPNDQYVTAKQVFWGEQPFGRFRYQLSSEMRKYNDLLEKIGVREKPEPKDARDVLLELAQQYGDFNQPLDDETHAVCITCWRMLSSGLEEEKISDIEIWLLAGEKVIPDVRKVLNPPNILFFEDRAGIAAKFGEFLKNNVIIRPQGAWKAMAVAGVRILSTEVESRIIECTDPVESELLMKRIQSRKPQLARVLEPLKDSIILEKAMSLLEKVKNFEVKELRIQFLLRTFGREIESVPEDVPAFYHKDEDSLYFVERKGHLPWNLIARELALAISSEIDPGQVASGFKEVLSAESNEEAKIILDELGFAPLETKIGEISDGMKGVEDFGGQVIKTEEEVNTVEEAIKCILGKYAVVSPEKSPLLGGGEEETTYSAGSALEGEHKGERDTVSRKKRGRLRTYVYPEDSVYEGGTASGATDEYSAIDKAGIDRVVEFEKNKGRSPIVMPPKHPGYDIESKDEAGKTIRYIEVKSLSGDWGMTGAALTKPQFKKAQEDGEKYWLYIVERAQQNNYKIHRIQDPAQRVDQFIYDDGWKNLAENEAKSQDEAKESME